MKIRILICQAGVGFVRNTGDIIDLKDDEATRLIEAGYAEPVKAAKAKKEKATKQTENETSTDPE
jgi:hypothetical protein